MDLSILDWASFLDCDLSLVRGRFGSWLQLTHPFPIVPVRVGMCVWIRSSYEGT